MPYGNLAKQACQRFGELADLDLHKCTIEEREEYEPHIMAGNIVYAGVDYGMILAAAEKEADVIVWDGGNNDTSFYQADLYITVADPHRPGHELRYYPGETNLRLADVVILNKVVTAPPDGVLEVRQNVTDYNPGALVIEAASPITVEDPSIIQGKRVLVIEDGPTLTHGEMLYGAGIVAARNFGAAEIVDPKPYAKGTIAATFEKYSHIEGLLPAMGYGDQQVADLEATINAVPCDAVVIGTPIDLRRILKIKKPSVRVTYELQEIGKPDLTDVLARIGKKGKK
jgi:predicted GTPase